MTMKTKTNIPTLRSLEKLSRAEIEERLKAYDLDWETQPYFGEIDEEIHQHDPWAPKDFKPETREEHAEFEHRSNARRLQHALIAEWLESLDLKAITKLCREQGIELTNWTKRSSSLADLRKRVRFDLRIP